MGILETLAEESTAKASIYWKEKDIASILEVGSFLIKLLLSHCSKFLKYSKKVISTGLTYEQPEDPLSYIEQCVSRIRKHKQLGKLQWDALLPPPVANDPKAPIPLKGKSLDNPLPSVPYKPVEVKPVVAPTAAVAADVSAKSEPVETKKPLIYHNNIVFVLGGILSMLSIFKKSI
jgi:hypothetical protein